MVKVVKLNSEQHKREGGRGFTETWNYELREEAYEEEVAQLHFSGVCGHKTCILAEFKHVFLAF